MKTVSIFVGGAGDDGIWSVQMDGKEKSELELFFDRLNDVEWLYDFFESQESDLFNGFFSIMSNEEAVLKTLMEVEEMERALYNYAQKGFTGRDSGLSFLFRPLSNHEYSIYVHQKSKARFNRGWLRLYAIRLAPNCFVVTGGAIKLTQDMTPRYLRLELRKLERVKAFLQQHGIDYPSDLNNIFYE